VGRLGRDLMCRNGARSSGGSIALCRHVCHRSLARRRATFIALRHVVTDPRDVLQHLADLAHALMRTQAGPLVFDSHP
jgi:hypothetical protein